MNYGAAFIVTLVVFMLWVYYWSYSPGSGWASYKAYVMCQPYPPTWAYFVDAALFIFLVAMGLGWVFT